MEVEGWGRGESCSWQLCWPQCLLVLLLVFAVLLQEVLPLLLPKVVVLERLTF